MNGAIAPISPERMEQAARLGELGPQLLQGYHFSRPMPAEELGRWLARRQASGSGA